MISTFYDYIKKKGFELKIIPYNEGKLYQGYFELSDNNLVMFGILILDELDEETNYQIVFSCIVDAIPFNKKEEYLEKINTLNRIGQGYYYIILEEDGSVSIRMIGFANNYELIYRMLIAGAKTAKNVHQQLIS